MLEMFTTFLILRHREVQGVHIFRVVSTTASQREGLDSNYQCVHMQSLLRRCSYVSGASHFVRVYIHERESNVSPAFAQIYVACVLGKAKKLTL